MAAVRFQREVVRWGNGDGIRLTKAEAGRLNVKAHTAVDVEVRTEPPRFDPQKFKVERWGGKMRQRHTELAAEATDAGR